MEGRVPHLIRPDVPVCGGRAASTDAGSDRASFSCSSLPELASMKELNQSERPNSGEEATRLALNT